MKKCPYCLSEIQNDAKKCKHCGEWIEEKKSDKYQDKKINGIASSTWRLIIVLYFLITIPVILLIIVA